FFGDQIASLPRAVATGVPAASPEPESGADDSSESRLQAAPAASANGATPNATATAALQVEIDEALNSVGAFMGEQINVSRTVDGKILVNALVETDQRKRDLLAALTNFRSNPAIKLEIQTVAEAQARQRPQTGGANVPQTVDQVGVSNNES